MKIAIYGRGGFGREVAPLARNMGAEPLFISDDPAEHGPDCCALDEVPTEYQVVIAIADSRIRSALAERCTARGLAFGTVQSRSHERLGRSEVGEGAILCGFTAISDNVRVGRHFHANFYSYVGHDTVVGDFVTLAPRVGIGGNHIVGDHVYIGTGAVLRHGTPEKPLIIGEGAVIGMGAVVTRDVPPGVTVVGNPARILQSGGSPRSPLNDS